MSRRLSRRQVLELSATAAGAFGAFGTRGLEAMASRPARADLDDLAAAIRGRVIRPRSPGYQAARLVWNSRYDDARPSAVVEVAGISDVRTVIEFARDHGTRLVARGGAPQLRRVLDRHRPRRRHERA